MKPKGTFAHATYFPTCGEVFEFLVNGLDLTAWQDLYAPQSSVDDTRAKKVSDRLRDWATEADGRVPSREDFQNFILDHVRGLPAAEGLVFVLLRLSAQILHEHTETIREICAHSDRDCTRRTYARSKAPDALWLVFQFRDLLSRLPEVGGGPMLSIPLAKLLETLWQPKAAPHPLLELCFEHYSASPLAPTLDDANQWRSGKIRPRFKSLSAYYRSDEKLPGIMVNFGVAHLLEALSAAFSACVSPKELPDARTLLIEQAFGVDCFRQSRQAGMVHAGSYSFEDYAALVGREVVEFRNTMVRHIRSGSPELLDLNRKDLRGWRDYHERFSSAKLTPAFSDFIQQLQSLWGKTHLGGEPIAIARLDATFQKLRIDNQGHGTPLEGVMLAIEARLELVRSEKPTADELLRAVGNYQKAVAASQYRAGKYTAQIFREALGVAALIQRGEFDPGIRLLDWLKNSLAWWDLVGMGRDFDHEQEPQRIEKAERYFVDSLHSDLRRRWREALPLLALDHAYIGGLFGIMEPAAKDRLNEPLDKRQKRELRSAATGRTTTPLMEAIDRRDLSRAAELIQSGANLNVVNSTGDSCLTKAFACKDYDLVLQILRRGDNPIRRSVLVRETDKHRHNALELAVSHGRVDILRELATWKPGRGEPFDLSQERMMGEQTPLYYAVMLNAVHRMPPTEFARYAAQTEPNSEATKFLHDLLRAKPDVAKRIVMAKEDFDRNGWSRNLGFGNPERAGDVIDYLLSERVQVDVHEICTQGHTAFTLAAETRQHDVALRLLVAGSNVDHRVRGGATALAFAIRNDDYEMAKLLHEHRASDRIFVESIGRPIHAMDMSERIRQLFPRRF